MTGSTKMISRSPDKYAFGRHETFPLRFGWLIKGCQAWSENRNVFEDGEGMDWQNQIPTWVHPNAIFSWFAMNPDIWCKSVRQHMTHVECFHIPPPARPYYGSTIKDHGNNTGS